jgi:outer membrane receptor protein involved in Fe transport
MRRGSRSWTGLFAEFNIPVVKDVDVSPGARYDDYSDFGGTFNPEGFDPLDTGQAVAGARLDQLPAFVHRRCSRPIRRPSFD